MTTLSNITNFPNGISAFGVPTLGVGGLLPFTGNYYFVNETTGSDGNVGSADAPLKTLAQAQSLATANQNDVVLFTGTIHQTASLVWAKNQVHLIGLCDPLQRGKRARISVSGSTGFNKLLSTTASGCWMGNFGTFFGWTDSSTSLIAIEDSGGRNCYDGVEFLGFGDGTVSTGSSNLTGSRAMKITGSTGEITIRNSVFGVDTTTRNATNYTLEITGGAPRVTLENCDFEAYLGASGSSSSHLLIGSGGIDRYLKFDRCKFMNSTGSGATAMTQALNVSSSAGGMVLLEDCTGFGFTHWETSASGRVLINMAAPTAHDGGIAVAASPS